MKLVISEIISLLVLITRALLFCFSNPTMNVLNQLDSESSCDSNGNAMEDQVEVEDGESDHSKNESDQVTTSLPKL